MREHLLVDGYDLVLDLYRSRGVRLVDQRDGTAYRDMFGFFASSALGMNHPDSVDDPAFTTELAAAAVNYPRNTDIYT
ncbi:L-lysine 6-transaminase, partial [Rhodococcus ruber]|nr:L-lysine 6-transaminase [Rhodococcus ruber]